jgi:hypothetical protein
LTLVDRTNPAFWADGTPRSQNNGFTCGHGERLKDWAVMATNASRSRKLSEQGGVFRQSPPGLIPSQPKPESKSGQIREVLKAMPMTGREIAALVGIDPATITAFMQNDIQHGRIIPLREFKPVRYALRGGRR